MSTLVICLLIAGACGVVYWVAKPAEPKELARIGFFCFLLAAALLFAHNTGRLCPGTSP